MEPGEHSELGNHGNLTLFLWLFMSSLHCDFLILAERMALFLCVSVLVSSVFLVSAELLRDGERLRDTKTETANWAC